MFIIYLFLFNFNHYNYSFNACMHYMLVGVV